MYVYKTIKIWYAKDYLLTACDQGKMFYYFEISRPQSAV